MPFNGSGQYSPPGADFPAVANTLIQASKFNNIINDIATALSTAVTKDGQTVVTANIPFAGFALTNARLRALDGATGTPGWTWENDTDTGVVRLGNNRMAVVAGGSIIAEWSTVGAGFADDKFYIFGSADATKKLQLEVDGITTGTIRIWTAPDASIVVAGSTAAMATGHIPLVTTGGLLTDNSRFTYEDDAGSRKFSVVGSASGDARILVTNTHASGAASLFVSTTGTGDAYLNLSVTDLTTSWLVGVDNSDSDSFTVGNGAVVGDTNRLRITTAGAVTFVATATHTVNGPLNIAGSSAGQIVFPAAGVNPSSNANTFDTYEEGTWTVGFRFTTTGDYSVASETKEARYIKTAKGLFLYWFYQFTPTFTTSSGGAQITGAPFAHENVTNSQCLGRGMLRHNANLAYTAGNTMVGIAGDDSTTNLELWEQGSGVAASSLVPANFTSGVATILAGSLTFEATA